MSEEISAYINKEGHLVDPVAVAVIKTVEKHNCIGTFEANTERIAYFKQRIKDRGLSPEEWIIVMIAVDDPHGKILADILMPGQNWQAIRDTGAKPIARGFAGRDGIEDYIREFDPEAADKLAATKGFVTVVVDYGVAEIFEV